MFELLNRYIKLYVPVALSVGALSACGQHGCSTASAVSGVRVDLSEAPAILRSIEVCTPGGCAIQDKGSESSLFYRDINLGQLPAPLTIRFVSAGGEGGDRLKLIRTPVTVFPNGRGCLPTTYVIDLVVTPELIVQPPTGS